MYYVHAPNSLRHMAIELNYWRRPFKVITDTCWMIGANAWLAERWQSTLLQRIKRHAENLESNEHHKHQDKTKSFWRFLAGFHTPTVHYTQACPAAREEWQVTIDERTTNQSIIPRSSRCRCRTNKRIHKRWCTQNVTKEPGTGRSSNLGWPQDVGFLKDNTPI
jgi:hypothetical protein